MLQPSDRIFSSAMEPWTVLAVSKDRRNGEIAMADDLKQRAPQDASLISLTEDWEVRYWTKALGVSKERLAELVKQHGHSAAAVRKALGK
jgi:hypothetical protein